MPSKAFSVDLQAITQRRQVDQHIEQISQRVGAAGSLALGFSLHQLQTLAASASDVAVVVQAIHDDIRSSAPFHPSSGRSRRHEHRARSSTQDPVRRVWLYSGVSYVRLGRVEADLDLG